MFVRQSHADRDWAALGRDVAVFEDTALVAALAQAGYAIARRDQPCVITSARRDCRAPHGFGDYLRRIEAGVQAGLPAALEQAGC